MSQSQKKGGVVLLRRKQSIVAAGRDELPMSHLRDIGHYRHKVFVNYLGWSLYFSDDVDSDDLDGLEAV